MLGIPIKIPTIVYRIREDETNYFDGRFYLPLTAVMGWGVIELGIYIISHLSWS